MGMKLLFQRGCLSPSTPRTMRNSQQVRFGPNDRVIAIRCDDSWIFVLVVYRTFTSMVCRKNIFIPQNSIEHITKLQPALDSFQQQPAYCTWLVSAWNKRDHVVHLTYVAALHVVLLSFTCFLLSLTESRSLLRDFCKKMKPSKKEVRYVVCQFFLVYLTPSTGYVLHDVENFYHTVSLKFVPTEPHRKHIFQSFHKCEELDWGIQKAF